VLRRVRAGPRSGAKVTVTVSRRHATGAELRRWRRPVCVTALATAPKLADSSHRRSSTYKHASVTPGAAGKLLDEGSLLIFGELTWRYRQR